MAAGGAAFAALAGTTYWSARGQGAYFPTVWPLLAAVVLTGVFALLLAGRRPTRRVTAAAAAITAFGVWSALSVAWGGIPDVAWTTLDQAILAGAALVLGSLLAGATRFRLIAGGALAGISIQAVEILYRLQGGAVPSDWFDGRKVQGTVGYANAQGGLLALGILLALWLVSERHVAARVLAGASAATLLGALLLTQSRGAMLSLAIAAAVQVVLRRDSRTAGFALLLVLYGAVLWRPLRTVDHALIDGRRTVELAAFRHDTRWVALGVAAFVAVAAIPPATKVGRRLLIALPLAAIVASLATVAVVRPQSFSRVHSALSRAVQDPADLPGGSTRLTSVSLTGRVKTWRVAWRLFEAHPLLGAGKGVFARAWDLHRSDLNLSVLQPHSIELEALSELGIPGLVLFAAFVALAAAALAGRSRDGTGAHAAGAAVLALIVLQASVDWTLSFPALVVAASLVIGAASGSGDARPTGILAHAALVVAGLAALVSFGGPFLSARAAGQADAALTVDSARALTLARRARAYDPWSSDAVRAQARAAARLNEPLRSAALYKRAASLSQRPWQDELARAQVLAAAGFRSRSAAACRTALRESPLEPTLTLGFCGHAG